MNTKRIRHRAEVIEIYPNEGKAAVQFDDGRFACVTLDALAVGVRGMVELHFDPVTGNYWTFAPFKSQEAV